MNAIYPLSVPNTSLAALRAARAASVPASLIAASISSRCPKQGKPASGKIDIKATQREFKGYRLEPLEAAHARTWDANNYVKGGLQEIVVC